MAAKTVKSAKMPKRISDSMAYSAMEPKSLCTCGHAGDGARSEHTGFGGHGACIIGDCACGQFSWSRWAPAYNEYMAKKGHWSSDGRRS